jgi:hypothetical protein
MVPRFTLHQLAIVLHRSLILLSEPDHGLDLECQWSDAMNKGLQPGLSSGAASASAQGFSTAF